MTLQRSRAVELMLDRHRDRQGYGRVRQTFKEALKWRFSIMHEYVHCFNAHVLCPGEEMVDHDKIGNFAREPSAEHVS